ncbi:hypothetical protein BKP44_17045 [Formosa algae]|nr:hypothetical protein BKP44_17045 [Formosa algae]
MSVKKKSEKQLKEEYAKCVTGLGLLVTGISFMSSAGIEKVDISAYTQRVDKKMDKLKTIIFIQFNWIEKVLLK